jgi:RND superfamily putative drug exporter
VFDQIGHLVVRRRKSIFAFYLIFIVVAGVIGSGVFNNVKSQGYDNPNSESATVDKLLVDEFKVRENSVVLIVDTPNPIDDPRTETTITAIAAELSTEENVESVSTYWTTGKQQSMVSTDGKATVISIFFPKGIDPETASNTAGAIQEKYDGERADAQIYVAGLQTVYYSINTQIKKDLIKAETIAVPLNILLLLIIFGTAIAAGLPMVVALGSILGSFLVLFSISQVTDISVFSLNLITGLGLGLGIDYALLIVNRFREELHSGKSVEDSVIKTVTTAGRTVFFSGVAVMLVLGSMILFPQYFLKSFAYAGISVVLFAILASIFALPALLALLGKNVDKWKVRRSVGTSTDTGAWAVIARKVMARPLIFILGSVALLGLFAAPAANVKFGQVDDRVLPPTSKVSIAAEVSRTRFDGQASTPIELVIPKTAASPSEVENIAKELAEKSGVVSVLTPATFTKDGLTLPLPAALPEQETNNFYRVTVVTQDGPRQASSVDLLTEIREMDLPQGRLIGGASAVYADSQAGIADHMPQVIGWLTVATLLVLFMYTGSILLPIKAVLLNLASLAATLGLITYVFQEGNLKWLVGDFTVTGVLDTSTLVLVAVVAFGLSMDYELFMLSRIKEEHDNGASTEDAVSFGLQKSGRIISAAAILIALVFITFITSGVTSIKMLGLGTAFAIILDATIVRAILVPALMRVAGKWNWWAPKPLAKFHARFGITD